MIHGYLLGLVIDKIRLYSQGISLVMAKLTIARLAAIAWQSPPSFYHSGQTTRVLCKNPNINLCK
jgi:hypothetical protein